MISLLLIASSYANLIANGGFEVDNHPKRCNSLWCGIFESNEIAPWSVQGNVDWVSNKLWSAHDGCRSIDLNGEGPASIGQTISVTPGHYKLTYWINSNSGCGPIRKEGQVTVECGSSSRTLLKDTFCHSKGQHWKKYKHVIKVPKGTNNINLSFKSLVQGCACGPVLDDVKLVPIQKRYRQ